MNSDPYAWIDPYEAIQQANRRAERSFEAGSRSVLQHIKRIGEDRFHNQVHDMATRAAQQVVRKAIEPAMSYVAPWDRDKAMQDEVRVALDGVKPQMDATDRMTADFWMESRIDTLTEEMSFRVALIEPFQYTVTSSIRAF